MARLKNGIAASDPVVLRTLMPVSYTHLDVYKRQEVEWTGAAGADRREWARDAARYQARSVKQILERHYLVRQESLKRRRMQSDDGWNHSL